MKRMIAASCIGLACFLASASTLAASISYTYDAAGRLAKADYGDDRSISYTYDADGNLLTRQVEAPSEEPPPTPPTPPTPAAPVFQGEDGEAFVPMQEGFFIGGFMAGAQSQGAPVLIELPPSARDACPDGAYVWTVYNLQGEKLNVRDRDGNRITGDDGMETEAGIVSPDGDSLRFDLTDNPGYYHLEATCTSSEALYAMGMVVE